MIYRIKSWAAHYENNRSKDIKKLEWVPVPNRMDGDGYTELMDHTDGPAHLGAWLAIVQIASRCDPRGTLVRDGGKAHDPASLSRISRIPAEVFAAAIPRFLSIGWIEEDETVRDFLKIQKPAVPPQESAPGTPTHPQEGADATHTPAQEGAASRAREKEGRKERTEGKEGKEGKEGTNGVLAFPVSLDQLIGEAAERMYSRHPKKKNLVLVPDALRKAVMATPDPPAALVEIESCHAAWVLDPDWTKKNGDFAPKLAEWIADRGYTAWPTADIRAPDIRDQHIIANLKALEEDRRRASHE